MNIEEIRRKMLEIKKELLFLLKNNKDIPKNDISKLLELDSKIHLLYNEYLKLYVQVDKKTPEFNDNWQFPHSSCYYYALNLPTPIIFESIYEELTDYPFESHLGSISNLPYQDNFNKNDVLEYLYSDLDALKIKWYDSEIESFPKHDGYKIVLLVNETPDDSDFHFVRQNNNGLWSEKYGCGSEVVSIITPEEFLKDPIYKYVKTLELVKPTINR